MIEQCIDRSTLLFFIIVIVLAFYALTARAQHVMGLWFSGIILP